MRVEYENWWRVTGRWCGRWKRREFCCKASQSGHCGGVSDAVTGGCGAQCLFGQVRVGGDALQTQAIQLAHLLRVVQVNHGTGL